MRKLCVEVGVELGCLFAECAEMLDHTKILDEQHGQDLVANPHPLEVPLMIRRIIDERKTAIENVGPKIGTTAVEERSDHTVSPSWRDPPEATEPGATKNPSEHRFGLIVLAVTDRNARCAMRPGDLMESVIPELAGPALNRRPLPRHLDPCAVEGNAEVACQRRHLLDFGRGFRPETVIDRRNADRDA